MNKNKPFVVSSEQLKKIKLTKEQIEKENKFRDYVESHRIPGTDTYIFKKED